MFEAASCSTGHLTDAPRVGCAALQALRVQHAAQALPALDLSRASAVAGFWTDELVSQSLMIALAVIMSNEVLNGFPQRLLAEEDHAIQARLLDAAHKSLRVCVQIRDRGGSFTDSTP